MFKYKSFGVVSRCHIIQIFDNPIFPFQNLPLLLLLLQRFPDFPRFLQTMVFGIYQFQRPLSPGRFFLLTCLQTGRIFLFPPFRFLFQSNDLSFDHLRPGIIFPDLSFLLLYFPGRSQRFFILLKRGKSRLPVSVRKQFLQLPLSLLLFSGFLRFPGNLLLFFFYLNLQPVILLQNIFIFLLGQNIQNSLDFLRYPADGGLQLFFLLFPFIPLLFLVFRFAFAHRRPAVQFHLPFPFLFIKVLQLLQFFFVRRFFRSRCYAGMLQGAAYRTGFPFLYLAGRDSHYRPLISQVRRFKRLLFLLRPFFLFQITRLQPF